MGIVLDIAAQLLLLWFLMYVLGEVLSVDDSAAGAAVELVTVLPPASCTVTTGWVAHTELRAPPPGWVVNASLAAAPTVMLNVELVADVRVPLVAVRV